MSLSSEQEKAVMAEILKWHKLMPPPATDDLEAWKTYAASWQLAWAGQLHVAAVEKAKLERLMASCDKSVGHLLKNDPQWAKDRLLEALAEIRYDEYQEEVEEAECD